MSKIRLAVLFGGVSVEHEVSIITGLQLIKNIDQSKYEIIPIYIDKTGKWWSDPVLTDVSYYKQQDLFALTGVTSFSLKLEKNANPIDVALLCFHGEYGEAGAIQGALELAGIPYQGPGLVSSAIAFDKVVTRQILAAEDIQQAAYDWFTTNQWATQQAQLIARIEAKLAYPIFVKAANGGSTIGLEKAKNRQEFIKAVTNVSQFDERIVVEAEITDCIEINVSVLGIEGNVEASVPEQPIKTDEFLSYADKYERGGGKKSGMASATRRIPAPISSALTTKIQDLAKKLFHIFDCSGVVRIDFFANPSTEEIFVVELNTIPGSMSFYLWEATNLPYEKMIDKLVSIAQEKFARRQKLVRSFDSNILKNN